MRIKNIMIWCIIYFNYINSLTEKNTDNAESLCGVIQNVTPHSSKMASLSEQDFVNFQTQSENTITYY